MAGALAALLAMATSTAATAEAKHVSSDAAHFDPAGFPDRATYRGEARDASGARLAGTHSFEVRYFDGARELLVERHEGVAVAEGRFRLELGLGATAPGSDPEPAASLQEVFARAATVAMEIAIDGVRQAPRVAVLPAGHSAESRLILAGRASADDPAAHTKGYRAKSAATAVQAAILGPAGAGSGTPAVGDGVFEMEVRGPWVSLPLRTLPTIESPELFTGEPEEVNRPRHETLVDADGYPFGTRTKKIVDPLVEHSRRPSAIQTPTPILNFPGVGNIQGYYPPDTEGAVGPNHYAQVVNVSYAIFDKTGTLAGGPWDTNALWASAPGTACATHNDGDAIFNYDQFADRWMLTQFAVQPGQIVCFAISQTGDPLGAYYLYEVTTPRFPDYFKIGIWPDPTHNAFYMGTNSGFQGQYDVFAVDRENMLLGLPARPTQVKQSYLNLMMPADVDGPTLPPAGSPGLFYTFRDGGEPYFGSPPADSLDLWAFDVDWATPANTTYTMIHSFTNAAGGFIDFNWSVCGFFASNCLPQPGTAVKIDSASWWPMQRLAYRNFGGHESLVGAWTVDVTGSPDLAAPRWFELRRSGGPWSIYQQGTHSPDGDHRWMPSIAQDRDGNIAIGYSVVNAPNNLYPSIRYATRAAGDPLGTLQGEQTLFLGGGSQTGPAGRWGDYSSMTVDPTDDCTFWYSTEYLESTGSAPWKTRVGTFKVPGCGGLAATPTSREVCGSVGSVDYTLQLFEEFTVSTDLSVTGCPATCGFSDDPVVAPDTDSVLTVSGLGALSTGLYNFTVSAQDADSLRDLPLALQIYATTPATPTPASPGNGATEVASKPTFMWAAVADANAYRLELDNDSSFATPYYSVETAGTSHALPISLPRGELVYWRVTALNSCGDGTASSSFSFTTSEALCWQPNLPIPDDPDVSDTRTVVGLSGNITDLDLILRATHTWVSDMIFRLVHVDTGTTVTVIDRPGTCSGDNFDVRLNDEGPDGTVESACNPTPPAVSGDRTPNNPLSAFDGQSISGSWRLECSDQAGQDTGNLQEWCLDATGVVNSLIFADDFEFGSAGRWSDIAD